MSQQANINEDPRKVFMKNFNTVNQAMLRSGFTVKELQKIVQNSIRERNLQGNQRNQRRNNVQLLPICLYVLIPVLLFLLTPVLINLIEFCMSIRCFFPNNYIIYEATRPVSDCNYCKDLKKPIILTNLSKEYLEQHAYSSQPIIIKKAAADWPALKLLNYSYIKDLYLKHPEAFEADCKFLPFNSNFRELKEVFEMPQAKVDGHPSWYVAFGNCYGPVLKQLRKIYPIPPPFLPDDVEIPDQEYIFMGYEQGAIMLSDYNSRLIWQAQLQGNKTWILAPLPECDEVCASFSFYSEASDVILLDTRMWFYGTYVDQNSIEITIQSEYG